MDAGRRPGETTAGTLINQARRVSSLCTGKIDVHVLSLYPGHLFVHCEYGPGLFHAPGPPTGLSGAHSTRLELTAASEPSALRIAWGRSRVPYET